MPQFGESYKGIFATRDRSGALRLTDLRQTTKTNDTFGQQVTRTGQFWSAFKTTKSRLDDVINAENERREAIHASTIGLPPEQRTALELLPQATKQQVLDAMKTGNPNLSQVGSYLGLSGPSGQDAPARPDYDHPDYESVEDAAQDPNYKAGRLLRYFGDSINQSPVKDPIATEAALQHGYPPVPGGYIANPKSGAYTGVDEEGNSVPRTHLFEAAGESPRVVAANPALAKSWAAALQADPTGGSQPELRKYIQARDQGIIPSSPGREPVFSPRLHKLGAPVGQQRIQNIQGQTIPSRPGMPTPITQPQPLSGKQPGAMPFAVQGLFMQGGPPTREKLQALQPYRQTPEYPTPDTLTHSTQAFMQLRMMSKGDPKQGMKASPAMQFTLGETKHNFFDFIEGRVGKGSSSGKDSSTLASELAKYRFQISEQMGKTPGQRNGALIADLNNRAKHTSAVLISDALLTYGRDPNTKGVIWTSLPVMWSPSEIPGAGDEKIFFPSHNRSIPLNQAPLGQVYIRPLLNPKKTKVPGHLSVEISIKGLKKMIREMQIPARGGMKNPMESSENPFENPGMELLPKQ
jgi:hypothetical protein